jgi:hypothetical protein
MAERLSSIRAVGSAAAAKDGGPVRAIAKVRTTLITAKANAIGIIRRLISAP